MHGSLPLSFHASMFRLCVRRGDLRCVACYRLNPKLNNNISPRLENTRKEQFLFFFFFFKPLIQPWSVENCLESCFSFFFCLFVSPSKMLLCNIPEAGQHSRLQRKSGWISNLCRKAGKVQNTHAHIFVCVWLWGGTKSFGRRFERVGSVVLSYQMCCLWNQREGTASVLLTDIVRGTALAPNKHSAEETDDLHICLRRPVCLLPFRPFLCAAEQTLPH